MRRKRGNNNNKTHVYYIKKKSSEILEFSAAWLKKKSIFCATTMTIRNYRFFLNIFFGAVDARGACVYKGLVAAEI